MNLTDLQTRLKKNLSSGILFLFNRKFFLNAADLPSDNIKRMFKDFFPSGRIDLKGASLKNDGTTITVRGRLKDSLWGESNLTVKMEFTLANGNPELVITLNNFSNKWEFVNTFPTMKDTIFDEFEYFNVSFAFDSQKRRTLPPDFQVDLGYFPDPKVFDDQLKSGIYFSAQVVVTGIPPRLEWIICGSNQRDFFISGPIELRNDTPKIWLQATQNYDYVLMGKKIPVQLQLVAILSEIQSVQDKKIPVTFGRVVSHIDTNLQQGTFSIPIAASFVSSNSPLLSIESNFKMSGHPLKMGDIATLIGVDQPQGFFADISSALDHFALDKIGFDFSLDTYDLTTVCLQLELTDRFSFFDNKISFHDIGVLFRVSSPLDTQNRSVSATLFAQTDIAGKTIDGMISLPSTDFSVSLAPDDKIEIKNLIETLLSTTVDMPAIDCVQFTVNGTIKDKVFSIFAEIESDWVIDLEGNSFALKQLQMQLDHTPTGNSGRLYGVIQIDSTTFYASAASEAGAKGWTFAGGTISGDINLTALSKQLVGLFHVNPSFELPEITLQNLFIQFNTGSKAFNFKADVNVTTQLPIGAGSFTLHTRINIDSSISATTKQRTFTGNMEADWMIGENLFILNFEIGTAKTVQGSWQSLNGETIGINDLLGKIGASSLEIPSGLDLALTQIEFEYNIANHYFTLAAVSNHYGDLFVTISNDAKGNWGVVLGVNIPSVEKLSDLPVIGGELKAADFITFKQVSIMISNATIAHYTIPQLPALSADNNTSPSGPGGMYRSIQPIGQGSTLSMSPGVSLAAVLDFSTSTDNVVFKNAASLMEQSEITIQVSYSASLLKLFASLGGRLGIPAGSSKLYLSDAAVTIDLGTTVVFQFSGSLQFSIDGTDILATARMVLGEEEAQVAMTIESDNGTFPGPPALKGVHFTEFGIIMGVYFVPPGLDLGIQGKFQIGQELGKDEFGLVLEIVEEVPNILYMSFYLEEMDLGEMITAFTDKSSGDLINTLKIVEATDVSFYFAENAVVLPDGTVAQPGFGCSATIKILDFGAHADFEINTSDGIKGTAQMSPVSIRDILSISGDGAEVKYQYVQINGDWQRVPNNQILKQNPPLPVKEQTVIQAGGPIIHIDSFGNPIFHANWEITLFDLLKEKVDITITNDGSVSFLLQYQVASIASLKMQCALKSWDHFSGSADFSLGIHETIGPISFLGINCGSINLDVSADANFSITLNPDIFSMSIGASFSFEGVSLSIPEITLSVAPKSLEELPGLILDAIRDAAEDLFKYLFEDAYKWAEYIGKGIIVAYEEASKVLREVFNVAADEAVKIMKQLGHTAEQIAQGLKEAYQMAEQGVATALKAAGYAADEVASSLKSAYNATADAAAVALQGAGYAVGEVSSGLSTAYNATADTVAQALKGAGYAADEVASGLKSAYNLSTDAAAVALKGAGYTIDQIGSGLSTAYGATADTAAQALKYAGYSINEISSGLQAAYNLGNDALAGALKGAGYTVNEVGDLFKNAYGLGGDAVNAVLGGAGYAADEISGFMGDAFGWVSDVY